MALEGCRLKPRGGVRVMLVHAQPLEKALTQFELGLGVPGHGSVIFFLHQLALVLAQGSAKVSRFGFRFLPRTHRLFRVLCQRNQIQNHAHNDRTQPNGSGGVKQWDEKRKNTARKLSHQRLASPFGQR
jgi:hypothetical protein